MSKTIIKIVIIVGALGAAGVIYGTTGRAPKAGVAVDAKAIDFFCTKCNHNYQVPYDEFKKAQEDAAARESQEDGGSKMKRRRDVRPPVLVCPQCSEEAALPANRCARHSVFYPKTNMDGSKGRCSQCQ